MSRNYSSMPNLKTVSIGSDNGFFHHGITGVVVKQADNETLGISFRDDAKEGVLLGKIQGRFEAETDLVTGLKVLHINGTAVESATQAATLVRSIGGGQVVTVAADALCLTASKKWRNDKVGIALQSNGDEEAVTINDVDINGLFPTLQQGYKLVAVNGHVVLNLRHAQNLLATYKTLKLVIVADDDGSTFSSSRSLNSYSPSSSVSDELELLEPIHFQMQDFEDDEVITDIAPSTAVAAQ